MASLTWDKSKSGAGKTCRIQFCIGDRRQAVRLGKTPVKVAATWLYRIEQLVANHVGGVAHDADLAGWLRDLPDAAHGKLSHVGLVMPREAVAVVTLGQLIDAFTTKSTAKPTTLSARRPALDSLILFFGLEKPLASITTESADEWRGWIASDREGKGLRGRSKQRMTSDNRLAPATVSKWVKAGIQVFAKAVRWGWLAKNPFSDLRAGSQVNHARSHYVSLETTAEVIDACPNVQWRLVVALCRMAGLRCPSEVGAVAWGDVNWEKNRLTVRSKKTEHHGGDHAIRVVPIVPELHAILAEAFDRPDAGTFVVPMAATRGAGANLRTTMEKVIVRAGCQPWPRLFQNLRASFETDLVEKYPAHVVAKWLGHSPKIAADHYLMSREHHFDDAVNVSLGRAPQSGAQSGAVGAQKAAQQAPAGNRTLSHVGSRNTTIPEETVVFPGDREVLYKRSLGPAGLEPATKGLCLPLRLSPPLSGSWSGPYLRFTRLPSGLYTFRRIRRRSGGLARDRHASCGLDGRKKAKRSPSLADSTGGPVRHSSAARSPATHREPPCSVIHEWTAPRRRHPLSPLL